VRPPSPLERRAYSLQSLANQTFDILVIGGGITGAGIARRAAWQQLNTCQVEQNDYASGTSSRSTKLLHGGLRYLEQFQFGLVSEAVRERMSGYDLAPHLVRPLPFVFPRYKGDKPGMTKLGIGLWIYDAMARFKSFGKRQRLSAEDLQSRLPQLRTDELKGAWQYFDAQTNDARLTLEAVLDAEALGATVFNRLQLENARRDGDAWVCGVRNFDGTVLEIRARRVAIATGVWLGETAKIFGATDPPRLRPTKGVHVHVSDERLQLDAAVVMTHPKDRRLMFAIPVENGVMIGTTDDEFDAVADEFDVTTAEVEYLLDAVNHYFPRAGITPADVHSAYAGLRPLLDDGTCSSSKVSREHAVIEIAEDVWGIGGGKLTTWRVMADDLLRAALGSLQSGDYNERPLPGGRGIAGREQLDNSIAEFATAHGISEKAATTMLFTYGARADEAIGNCRETIGSLELPVSALTYAVTNEHALTLDDLLRRRTRLYYTEPDQARSLAAAAADAVAPLLGWDGDAVQREIDDYTAMCKRYDG